MMLSLGEKLKILRLEKNLTQTDVSKRIGATKSMISSYELEQRHPSYAILVKFASFYGVSADYLLGVEKHRMISVDGLLEEDIKVVVSVIAALRRK
jgi:transcriptional regulator with XRE-family HTH domain